MPAVVRIKRRIDEEPHTAFVLNSKRRRVQNDENTIAAATAGAASPTDKDELSTVLKFAGTLENQDDCATKQFAAARLNKATAKDLVQQKSGISTSSGVHRRDKLRNETQQAAREQRFRVVNCLRTTLDTENANDGATSTAQLSESAATPGSSQITIVDIESQQARTSDDSQLNQQQPADSDVGYVYDLYVPENEQEAAYVDMMDDNYLSVSAFGSVVLHENWLNDQVEDYDSDDSNHENYYKNSYGEAEDTEEESDNELCDQMNKFIFDDDEDEDEEAKSSEDEDYNTFRDPYVHTIDTEADSFVDDVDFFNVERQGTAYERYKRRILREMEEGKDYDDDTTDDESIEEQDKEN